MDSGKNRHADHLGINRISRNIRKSPPIHAQTFANPSLHQNLPQSLPPNQPQNQIHPAQPQVYNISKNDFRSVVQQLTGTPTRDPFPAAAPPPTAAPRPKVPSLRLQKIRPPPLSPIARPPVPHPAHANPSYYPRQFAPPLAQIPSQPPHGTFWRANLESPTTAYMKYLESSIINGGGTPQAPAAPPQAQPALQAPPPSAGGLLPTPPQAPTSSGLLPSPSSQLFMASPTAFMNLSPFPVLSSPKFQFPPLSPGFQFSPLPGQSGILGPGPPGSPLFFPSSPSGFLLSPKWRDP